MTSSSRQGRPPLAWRICFLDSVIAPPQKKKTLKQIFIFLFAFKLVISTRTLNLNCYMCIVSSQLLPCVSLFALLAFMITLRVLYVHFVSKWMMTMISTRGKYGEALPPPSRGVGLGPPLSYTTRRWWQRNIAWCGRDNENEQLRRQIDWIHGVVSQLLCTTLLSPA